MVTKQLGKRPKRTSINGKRDVLTVSGKDPNFVYRIVNDTGDRVNQFEQDGYDVVSSNEIRVGDRRIANPTAEGSPVMVSVGGGMKGVLMRTPKEWYDEAQAEKAEYVDRTEEAIQRKAKEENDFFGEIKISR